MPAFGRLALVRAALSPEAQQAAWQEGQAMPPEEAVAYALEQNAAHGRSGDAG